MVDPQTGASVRQVPEPLPRRSRSRVRKVSGGSRSHGVHHEPGSHTTLAPVGVCLESA